MKKLKVMVVLGTRPEIIRLSSVIKELEKNTNLILVHTGQKYDYELNHVFFEDLGIKKPKIFLNVSTKSALNSIGEIISKTEACLDKHKPDAFLILGDTNSCLSAISAKKKKVPIFHMEAGNRCFDQRVPEETNRKIVDHISDINLPYSDIAREYLLNEGIHADRIVKTGSPMYEVVNQNLEKILASNVLSKLKLSRRKYFLVSSHREENVDDKDKLKKLVAALNHLNRIYNLPILFSTHPRTKKMLSKLKIKLNKNIILHKPFGYFDYVNLQLNARATLSDSGTINEESSILDFPAINIRDAHERPEGMEEGAVIMTGFNKDRIIQALNIIEKQSSSGERNSILVADYSKPNVSKKVLRIIASYIDYVNSKVWSKADSL